MQEHNLETLTRYSKLKLELASIIRSAMRLGRNRDDAAREGECRRLLARLAEDRFNLAVVGQFNRGKTSLMNALLRSDRLPTGVLPLTSVLTTVCYGDHERALIQYKGWSYPKEIRIDDLPQFVTEKGNPGNIRQVALAEVHLPAELLRLGFSFVDTPGVGSLIAANTVTTRDFLPQIDAAIFVTSFESPFNEGELAFFEEVRSHAQRVFVVINKADLVAPGQRMEILAFVRKKLAEKLADTELPVFALSARTALQAKLTGNGTPGRTGLAELERALLHLLRTQKAGLFLTHIADDVECILKGQRAEFDLTEQASTDPEHAALAWQQLRDKVERLQIQQEQLLASLAAELPAELAKHFQGELAMWGRDVQASVVAQVQQIIKNSDFLTLLGGVELNAQISGACQQQARAWLAAHRENFQEVVREFAARYADDLDRLVTESLKTDNVLLPVAANGSLRPERSSDVINRTAVLCPDAPPVHFPSRARWCMYALPLPFMKALVLRDSSHAFEERLSSYISAVGSSFQSIANDWVSGLRLKLAESLQVWAARAEQILQAKPEPQERADIDHLLTKLDELRTAISTLEVGTVLELEAKGSDPVPDRPEEGPRSDGLAACVICSRVEDELFRFMSQRQYELSTNENQQQAHAERGGFCAPHTWYYEAVASAQGICTAYPTVLMSLSRRLRSLSKNTAAPNSAAAATLRSLSDPRTCPACQLISEVEWHGAAEVVGSLNGGQILGSKTLPPLCLPHLATVLDANPDVQVARLLLFEESRILETIAEDMQRYALKHDAVRRQLATEGEWQAHKLGLARLAGSRNLSKPWKATR